MEQDHDPRPTQPPTPEDEHELEGKLTLDEMVAWLLNKHLLEDDLADLPALKEP